MAAAFIAAPAFAENRIDTIRADAPELAAYGDLPVGVRQIELTNPGQIDVVKVDPAAEKPAEMPMYDRPLTVEVWYPAADGAEGSTTLTAFLRDGKTQVELEGRAMRDADPRSGETYPLVMISHGYPGNRFLLSHLAENLASKGYVVASIDHTESTYDNQLAFGSTLVNRPFDQLFVLDEMDRLSKDKPSFLNGLVDASNTGLIGYSMGGYGALITTGAGVTDTGIEASYGAPHGLLAVHKEGSETQEAMPDDRIKAAVAFGPWGKNAGFWDEAGLSDIETPFLVIGGSQDDVSGYENGVRSIWENMKGTDRALLTFDNANHNAGAPMPAPAEAAEAGVDDHYSDAAWSNERMNNVSQHFVTAWLDKYLKGDEAKETYLDLVADSNAGTFAMGEDGKPTEDHTYWAGFENRTAKGLMFEELAPGE